MTPDDTPPRPKPAPVSGITHVFAAAGYSISGLRRLWKETAFRHIILGAPVCMAVLALANARFIDYCVMLILLLALVAVEALNTAIECIVDHLAPDWQEYARDAKDLGSLATLCLLCANGIFIGAVLIRSFALT
ncbi:diacylglycerol kinase [Sulfitobacter geojensis]|uniref:diacylglycerol kinase n=1 Tax=Sulfitobacter geojensis TaxID=1342299 RepID=UPI003B8C6941